jgi:hypothetical protein
MPLLCLNLLFLNLNLYIYILSISLNNLNLTFNKKEIQICHRISNGNLLTHHSQASYQQSTNNHKLMIHL